MIKKLYVLTHCSNELNEKPEVYITLERARKEMEDAYESHLYDFDSDGEVIKEYDCVESNIFDDAAIITWPDDAYDRWDIFEVEVIL